MESSQILGFFKILSQSIKIAIRNAVQIASLTTLSILLTSIIFLLFSFSSQTASRYMNNTIITDSTSLFIFLQIIIWSALSFAITFTFMLSYVAITHVFGFATVTATAASYTDAGELSLPDLFSIVRTKWRSPIRFRKNISGSTRQRIPIHFVVLIAVVVVGVPLVMFNLNPVTITIASAVGVSCFVYHLYASVAQELAAVIHVLEDGCEVAEAVEIAEKLVEGQRVQGFTVNLFFNILNLIGLLSFWMILGDLGSLSLNFTVYTLLYINCASVTRIFVSVAYTVYYFRCKEYHAEIQQFGNTNYTALLNDIP